jgi:hypothetical protein
MRTSWFEKFLKVTFGWPSLPLEVAFGSRYALLAGVIGFLIATTITGYNGDAMGSPLLPLLTVLSAFLGTFDGGLGRHGPATISDRSRVAQDEGGPNRLLIRRMLGCDVE